MASIFESLKGVVAGTVEMKEPDIQNWLLGQTLGISPEEQIGYPATIAPPPVKKKKKKKKKMDTGTIIAIILGGLGIVVVLGIVLKKK